MGCAWRHWGLNQWNGKRTWHGQKEVAFTGLNQRNHRWHLSQKTGKGLPWSGSRSMGMKVPGGDTFGILCPTVSLVSPLSWTPRCSNEQIAKKDVEMSLQLVEGSRGKERRTCQSKPSSDPPPCSCLWKTSWVCPTTYLLLTWGTQNWRKLLGEPLCDVCLCLFLSSIGLVWPFHQTVYDSAFSPTHTHTRCESEALSESRGDSCLE